MASHLFAINPGIQGREFLSTGCFDSIHDIQTHALGILVTDSACWETKSAAQVCGRVYIGNIGRLDLSGIRTEVVIHINHVFILQSKLLHQHRQIETVKIPGQAIFEAHYQRIEIIGHEVIPVHTLGLRGFIVTETHLGVSIDVDHVHLYMVIPPEYSVSYAVETLKKNASLQLSLRFRFLSQVYWDNHGVWSRGSFVSTEGARKKVVQDHVNMQAKENTG